jgi:hypothetical protein
MELVQMSKTHKNKKKRLKERFKSNFQIKIRQDYVIQKQEHKN